MKRQRNDLKQKPHSHSGPKLNKATTVMLGTYLPLNYIQFHPSLDAEEG